MSPPTAAASGLAALFSLSQAAASAQPIPIQNKNDASQMKASGGGAHSATKHRRLSSIGQTRRRLSDARDAANRPAPASLHSAASAFASLSLSTSASPSSTMHIPVGLSTASPVAPTTAASALTTARAVPIPIRSSPRSDALAKSVPTHLGSSDQDIDVDVDDDDDKDVVSHKGKPTKGGGKGTGKKRGTIFRCESCSKVYRHPSCLVKHRWEHSPHWRESSKFLLSKHQQVQLLEAAAILTHLAPGTSLPEDRSLWPYYLSGGLLPPPSTATTALTVTGTTASSTPIPTTTATANATATPTPSSLYTVIPTSSSVPAQSTMAFKTRTRSGSVAASVSSAGAGLGPRLHDYKLPGGGITQIRPGLLGHPTPAGGVAALAATEQTSSSVVGHEDEDEDGDDVDREDDGHGEGGDEGEARDTPSPDMADLAIKATSPMPVPTHLNGYGPSRGSATFEAYRDHHHHHHNPHHHTAGGGMHAHSYSASSLSHSVGTGGWSLPRSDIRSGSVVSYSGDSRSRSGSGSGDDGEESSDEIDVDVDVGFGGDLDVDVDGAVEKMGYAFGRRRSVWRNGDDEGYSVREVDEVGAKKEEEEEWDGMDMDMEL